MSIKEQIENRDKSLYPSIWTPITVPLTHPQETTNLQELAMSFETKDSGERQEFSTGMVRDVQTDKPRYDLLDRPMLKRWAELMGRGAIKYGENNWKKAATDEELNRFKASAIRHLFQWLDGDESEDHGAAVMFNIAGVEMVKEKLKDKPQDIRQG